LLLLLLPHVIHVQVLHHHTHRTSVGWLLFYKEYLLVMFQVNPQLKCAVLVCKCTIVQKRNVV
jgi:hypothetical protein